MGPNNAKIKGSPNGHYLAPLFDPIIRIMPLAPYKFQLKPLSRGAFISHRYLAPAEIPPFLHIFDNTNTTMDLQLDEEEDDLIEDIIIQELLERHQSRPGSIKQMRTSMLRA